MISGQKSSPFSISVLVPDPVRSRYYFFSFSFSFSFSLLKVFHEGLNVKDGKGGDV